MGGTASKPVRGHSSPSFVLRPASVPPIPDHVDNLTPSKSEARLDHEVSSPPPVAPTPIAKPPAEPSTRRDLFLPLGPAFFSPSVPHSTIDTWTNHGGTIIPHPCGLLRVHQNAYLNTPVATIDALKRTLHASEYNFFIQDDPLLHFVRSRDISFIDSKWVGQCVRSAEVLSTQGYTVGFSAVKQDPAGEIGQVLARLAEQVAASSLSLNPPIEVHETPPVLPARIKRKRGDRRYILQPYLVLASSTNSSHPTPHHALPSDFSPSTRSILSTHADPVPHRNIQPHIGPSRIEAAFPQPDLPTFSFTLDTDLAPDFPLDQLDEAQMAQLVREIVEDASREMEGEVRYWDPDTREFSNPEEEVEDDRPGPSGAERDKRRGMEEEEEEEEEVVEERGPVIGLMAGRKKVKKEPSRLDIWLEEGAARLASSTSSLSRPPKVKEYAREHPRTPKRKRPNAQPAPVRPPNSPTPARKLAEVVEGREAKRGRGKVVQGSFFRKGQGAGDQRHRPFRL